MFYLKNLYVTFYKINSVFKKKKKKFNAGRMVLLQRRPVVNLMEGEWSCYRSGHFNGGRMDMLEKWSL